MASTPQETDVPGKLEEPTNAYLRSHRHNFDYVPPGLSPMVPDCYVQDNDLFLEQLRYWSTFISEVNKRSVYHARCISALAWHIEEYAFTFAVSAMLKAKHLQSTAEQGKSDPTIPPPAKGEKTGNFCRVAGCRRRGADQRHEMSHFRRGYFTCPDCRRTTLTETELLLHIEEHSRRARNRALGKHAKHGKAADGKIVCPICKCPFGNSERAIRHLRRIHSDVPGVLAAYWRPQIIE